MELGEDCHDGPVPLLYVPSLSPAAWDSPSELQSGESLEKLGRVNQLEMP